MNGDPMNAFLVGILETEMTGSIIGHEISGHVATPTGERNYDSCHLSIKKTAQLNAKICPHLFTILDINWSINDPGSNIRRFEYVPEVPSSFVCLLR